YPIAMATDEMRMEYGGIPALPTSFVLDGEGRVVQKHEGLRDPVLYEVEIRSLLGLPIGNVKVETFEDTGQIFLQHADRATQLPGVDLSKLTPEQKTVALHKFNAEGCSCGCQYTLAQCRIWDRNCNVSKEATTKIILALAGKSREGADGSSAAKPASAPSAERPCAEKPHPSLRRGFPFAAAGLGDGERQVSTSLAFPRDHLIVFFRSMPTLAKILFALAVLLSFTGYVSPPAALTAGMVFGLSF